MYLIYGKTFIFQMQFSIVSESYFATIIDIKIALPGLGGSAEVCN